MHTWYFIDFEYVVDWDHEAFDMRIILQNSWEWRREINNEARQEIPNPFASQLSGSIALTPNYYG